MRASVAHGVGLDFEGIIEIRRPAAKPDPAAGEKIRRDKERSPAFVLADVDAFMDAGAIELGQIRAHDDMAERDGRNCAEKRTEA